VVCPLCGSDDLALVAPTGLGTVYSVTTVRRKPDAGGDYNVCLIDLDEGVRLMSRVDMDPVDAVQVGQRVQARVVAQKMQESWQQTVVVENKPGAGGTIGHTVLFGIVALVQQMTLMKLPYDPIKDFAPISRVAISPSVLAAAPTLPINNLPEFIKLEKNRAQQAQHWLLRPRHLGSPSGRFA
jgi:hypothetical protein